VKISVDTTKRLVQSGGREFRCAIGKNGVIDYEHGREGDGKTPLGTYALRYGMYRKDRVELPKTALQFWPIHMNDGWCDAPDDPAYNRPVQLPYPASVEKLWRKSGVYDVVIVLGHNDSPPVPGLGSAIFLHIARENDGARENYAPTQGCVAIARADMLELIPGLSLESRLEIK